MLTAAQKSRCAKLAAALDAGDYPTYKRVEPSLTPEMRGEIWEQRAHVQEMAVRVAQGQRGTSVFPSQRRIKPPARIEASVDLDYWSDAEPVDPDDDDDDQRCEACGGTGYTQGGVCGACGGTGKAPPDDDDQEETDDDFED